MYIVGLYRGFLTKTIGINRGRYIIKICRSLMTGITDINRGVDQKIEATGILSGSEGCVQGLEHVSSG